MSNLKSQAFLEPHRTNSKFVWVSVAALTSVMIQHFFVYPVIKERFIYSLWRILLWTRDQGIFNGRITLMKCFGHVCFLQIFDSFDGWYMYIMRNQSQRCFEGGVFLLGNFSYNRWYPLHRFASKTVWILKGSVLYTAQQNCNKIWEHLPKAVKNFVKWNRQRVIAERSKSIETISWYFKIQVALCHFS